MSVDYDLIVLGGTAVGRYAAMQASQLGARVALVEPTSDWAASSLLMQHLFLLNRISHQANSMTRWSNADTEIHPAEIDWQRFCQGTKTFATTLEASEASLNSLSQLAAAGVEVIKTAAAFERQPKLALVVGNRALQSRAYLLAPAAQTTLPAIDGLTSDLCVSLPTWQPGSTLPQKILILGIDPRGIALAQVFNRFGVQVTLVTSRPQLIPHLEAETAFLLQAHLEAEGVTVLTNTQILQVKRIGEQVWVQAGDESFDTNVILLATQPQLDLSALNLDAAGVRWQPQRIEVNRKLQTSHPKIYACGEGLGGYALPPFDRYEADIAIHNALFWATKRVDYRPLPWVVFTDPQLVCLGLTETQARQRYGQDVLTTSLSCKLSEKAQLCGDINGVLKLIVRRNGEILGAHCLGAEASEWMGTIALAMQQRLKLSALAQLPIIPSTLSALIQQAAIQLQQQRRTEWQREGLETWFNFARSR